MTTPTRSVRSPARLITLSLALFQRAVEIHKVETWTAAFAALGGLLSGVMGHIAGWILEFGNVPKAIIGGWAALSAETWQSLLTHLISAHAHLMVVAVIALIVATFCGAFTLERRGHWLMRFGLWWTAVGVLGMTIVYVVAGATWAQPPTLFAHGVSGISGDDLVVGVGVMFGGLVALIGLAAERLPQTVIRWGSGVLTAMMFVTVVMIGFFIDAHGGLCGHGVGTASRAPVDAVYGWYHQDFALFLLPAVATLLLVLKQFARDESRSRVASLTLLAGSIVIFAGGILYVFVSPAVYGISFLVATIGMALTVIGVALGISALAGTGQRRAAAVGAPKEGFTG